MPSSSKHRDHTSPLIGSLRFKCICLSADLIENDLVIFKQEGGGEEEEATKREKPTAPSRLEERLLRCP